MGTTAFAPIAQRCGERRPRRMEMVKNSGWKFCRHPARGVTNQKSRNRITTIPKGLRLQLCPHQTWVTAQVLFKPRFQSGQQLVALFGEQLHFIASALVHALNCANKRSTTRRKSAEVRLLASLVALLNFPGASGVVAALQFLLCKNRRPQLRHHDSGL